MSPQTPFALEKTYTHRLHRLQKLTDRVTAHDYPLETGLQLSEGRCLSAIGEFKPLSVNDLARYSNLTKAQASRAAQSLVEQGLVKKKSNASDQRGVELSLTRKGEQAYQKAIALVTRRNTEVTQCLSPESQAQFSAALDALIRAAEQSLIDRGLA